MSDRDVRWARPEVMESEPKLQRLADFYEGTDAVRKRATEYLPSLPKETGVTYRMRRHGVSVPNFLKATVEASVGKLFAVAPSLDVTKFTRFEEHAEDIDGMGRRLTVAASMYANYAMLDGFSLVLVDAPANAPERVTLAEEAQYRPRWITYRRSQLRNWRHVIENGKHVLTLAVLQETGESDVDMWGHEPRTQYRVLRRFKGAERTVVTSQLFVEVERTLGVKVWEQVGETVVYRTMTEIPLVAIAARRSVLPFVVDPPLLGLCDKTIEFWQVACDIRHYERMACFPQPVVSGSLATGPNGLQTSIVVGPSSVVHVAAGGSFAFAELTGTSLAALREGQSERRMEIAAMGLSFLFTETRQAETARAKEIDASAENATLADAGTGIEDGINQALVYHAAYYNIAADDAPFITLVRNLDGARLDAAMVSILAKLRAEYRLTETEFRDLMARGGVIPASMAEPEAIAEAELLLAMEQRDNPPAPTPPVVPREQEVPA